ncbi:hypothetical protein AA101099_1734 [Neoasaia chiangmaiensis NBRC 101099]|uniref:Uncharacterized protein n=2 Tax=Neoasaia chiangmaiensis TaxID=320497 RepID=A0A1U9KUG5_9PROT|nr:hypothetical protein A0U93_10520 [Neoasaia chiangmaiensis]GBR39592.1 hypothetical protein AA101099_1734 [Neoasaia chiangmaiensis NBRC 101099]GEN14654.1 lipase [Neoasaia chiangmaiensis]
MRSVWLALGITMFGLAACATEPDEDAESFYAHVAAGQVISLKHQASSAPGTTYRMAYRSTDAHVANKLVAVSATVLVPYGTPPAGGWPVMAWAHGTSGIGLTCAPSIMGVGGPQASFYGAWLRRGFAVVATDYPGLGEPGTPLYLNARSEGMAVLDSVRAARRAVHGLSRDVVLQGHDQGAHAVISAAGLAASYAPDLHVKGTIAVGAPNLQDDDTFFDGQHGTRRFSPNVVYALMLGASLGQANPAFDPSDAFSTRALPLYRKAATECRSDLFVDVEHAGLTPGNSFEPSARVALAPALDWARYPTLTLAQPLFLGIGTGDTQIPIDTQEGLARKACAAGTRVTLHHYRGAEHTPALNDAQTDALAFARQVVDGQTPADTCR